MFAFIESFFLLSLGITFILIFLMVFHFKQRIEKLEKKNNNLSDLSNKIVKEIANLHSIYLMNQHQHQNQQQKNLINPREHICENIRITTSIPIPNNNFNENENNNNNANSPYKKIVVMDTIVDDDIMTVESSDSSEYEYNDSELDSESESVLLEEVVDIDIPIKDSKEEIHVIQLYDDEYEPVKESKEYSEKIFNDLVNEERETIVVKEEKESESEVFVQTTNYQKMNISKLRILAISKGLCSDTSKIKRADLIKLLESEEN
jgi:hypothetical protein